MGIVRRYWEIIKLVFKYLRFKYHQYSLKTKETFEVTTTYGKIRGCKRYSVWNDTFYSFEKIPFAKPPLNELRFKAPQPPEPWTDIKDCTSEGPVPLQTNLISKFVEGSEDCLYLNVYTKNLEPIKPMPVMVWIYGGGFETGGATKDLYSPDYFMQKDVVLITIAYRLGPFGFLSFNDPDLNIPGNAGLKDQVLALKWIKNNCAAFGGNPDSITLFGESAGAASIHYMMLTEQTKGLFHRAILMSGTALCPWAILPERQYGYRLAKSLGYMGDATNDKKCFEFIRNAKGKDLLEAKAKVLSQHDKRRFVLFPSGPEIEPYLTADCVIPEHPRIMMQKAWSNKIPMIIGGTSDEGLLFYPDSLQPGEYWLDRKIASDLVNNLKNCEYAVPMDLNLDIHDEKCIEYGLSLKRGYFKNDEPSMKQMIEYTKLMGDKMFWHPLHRTILSRQKYAISTEPAATEAEAHSITKLSSSSTYVYRFAVDSKILNKYRIFICGPNLRGVCHSDDLFYFFLTAITPNIKVNSQEYKIIQNLIDIWTKFAETGNPNDAKILQFHHNEMNDKQNIIMWEPLKKCHSSNNINNGKRPVKHEDKDKENDSENSLGNCNKYKCLNIDLNEIKFIDLPEFERMQIWDKFYTQNSLV